MAKPSIPLTAARLRELLHYDPDTGEFTRARANRAKKKVGRLQVSRSDNKYLAIGVDWGRYMAHRLAWLYMTGEWPKGDIDHINGNGLDNKWANLRVATRAQNNVNRMRLHRQNKSGYTGVRWHAKMGKWQAIFSFTFDTKEEAIDARRKVVEVLAGEFAPKQNAR